MPKLRCVLDEYGRVPRPEAPEVLVAVYRTPSCPNPSSMTTPTESILGFGLPLFAGELPPSPILTAEELGEC